MNNKYLKGSLNISVLIILSLLFILALHMVKPYEPKILILIILGLITLIIISISSFFSKNRNVYNLGTFIIFLSNVILLYNIIDLNTKYDVLKNMFIPEYQYIKYDIYVSKSTPMYSSIDKLSNKKIGMLDSNNENISQYLKLLSNMKCITYNNYHDLNDALKNGEVQSIILTEKEYTRLSKIDDSMSNKIRIIFTTKIKDNL